MPIFVPFLSVAVLAIFALSSAAATIPLTFAARCRGAIASATIRLQRIGVSGRDGRDR
jgi:hypothetical protein